MPENKFKDFLVQAKQFLREKKYIILILWLAIFSLFVSYFYIGYKPELVKDAKTYFEAAQFLQSGGVLKTAWMNRVLTAPLFLGSVIFMNLFFKDFILSGVFLNIIFYFLFILAFYLLALEIYKSARVAWWGTVLVATNFYIIDPGNAHLADLGGWFFFVLSTYLAVKYFNTQQRKFFYLTILSAVIGVFFKEYGALGLISLALLIVLSDLPKKQKIKDILLAGLLFLLPFLSYHLFVYLKYHYSYFDWYLSVKTVSVVTGRQARGAILLIKILGWLFSLGWLAWLLGLREEWRAADKRRLKILAALLPAALTFIIWPETAQRLAVILLPWLALTAGFALARQKWYWAGALVIFYALFNYNIKILINLINLPF